jgi:HlyD family secretion protein
MKTALKIIVPIVLVVAAYFGVRELSVSDVVATAVRRGSIMNSATGSVTVLPYAEARIIAPEKGNLIEYGFTAEDGTRRNYIEGDRVKKDQVLARLDAGRLPLDLKQVETDLEKLLEQRKRGSPQQARYEQAKNNLDIVRKLRSKGHRSEAEVRQLETDLKSIEVTMSNEELNLEFAIRRTEIQVKQLKEQLERFEIRSPFDGVIMAPSAVVGDLVFAGNSIGKVTSLGKMIKVEVNQDDLPAVRNSKRVSVRFFSFPDTECEIKKNTRPQIVPVGNSETQRFTVFVTLEKLPEGLMSGQTGEATFIADEHTNALLAQVTAVTGDSVYVVKDGRLEKRKIRSGYVSISEVEILDGLREGELVVSRDVDIQRDGDRVNIKSVK